MKGKTAFIFPGQGSQKAGMGKDFYETYETSRRIFDLAGEWLGLDMRALCFEENEKLNRTEYTQPALAAACLAMEKAAEERGLYPDVTAGLSLGEYCAIETAGGISLRDVLLTVRKRGILMEQAVPNGRGSMAAVIGFSKEQIENALSGITRVGVANYNCPGQIVITGERAAVEEASVRLRKMGGGRVVPLKVSGPFHSPMLARAGEKLEKELADVAVSALRIPYVTNVTAEYVTDAGQIKELLAKQISSPVRWQQSVERMIADGVETFVEIGPGKTLAGFIRKINRNVKVYNIQTTDGLEQVAAAFQGKEKKA